MIELPFYHASTFQLDFINKVCQAIHFNKTLEKEPLKYFRTFVQNDPILRGCDCPLKILCVGFNYYAAEIRERCVLMWLSLKFWAKKSQIVFQLLLNG